MEVVGKEGVEPSWVSPADFKSAASTVPPLARMEDCAIIFYQETSWRSSKRSSGLPYLVVCREWCQQPPEQCSVVRFGSDLPYRAGWFRLL